MARFAAFLRGMNLGNRRIKNPDLVRVFEGVGFEHVEAFLASGNVAFDAKGNGAALAGKIEKSLVAALSYEVPTFVRSAKELMDIAQADPFASRKTKGPRGKMQVAFLREPPVKGAAGAALSFANADDWLALGKTELYWWPRGGMSESELDLKGLEKVLGTMTIRTHGTIQRLVAKCFG